MPKSLPRCTVADMVDSHSKSRANGSAQLAHRAVAPSPKLLARFYRCLVFIYTTKVEGHELLVQPANIATA